MPDFIFPIQDGKLINALDANGQDIADANLTGTTLLDGVAIAATLDDKLDASALDTDGTMAADSDARIASQKATRTYIASVLAGVATHKGALDCSTNPNYPTALNGDSYRCSVAGKIGGASGVVVEVADLILCVADNAGGTQASVGASWVIGQANITGITAAGLDMMQAADADAQAALLSAFFLAIDAQAADVDPAGTDIALALAAKLPLAGGTMDENAVVTLFNDSKWQQSTPDKGIAGAAGFSIICSAGYEYKFANGYLFILSDGSSTVRKVLYAPATPTATDDTTLGYTTDTTWEMADGTLYECTDATATAAVWEVVPAVSAASTTTLTNKRITPRFGTATSSATPTINTDNVDRYDLTAQAADITSFTSNLSGTPTDGQPLWISVTGTAARAITWGASFESGAASLPTTTVSTDRLDVLFVWNAVTSKWRCVLTTATHATDATKLPLAGGTMDENAVVTLFNDSKWQQSTPDKGIAGAAGFSIICSVGYEYKFANGYLFILSDGSSTVRKVLYAPAAPTATDDTTLGYTTDTTWEMADGTQYRCTDATATAAVWEGVPGTDATKLPLAGGTMDANAVVNLFNGSRWQQSTPDKGIAGAAGFSIICSAGYEYKFALGYLFILSDNSTDVRKVLYAPSTPTATDDTTLGYTTDTTWEMADGTLYECTDATATAAVWEVVPAVSATDATKLPLAGGEMTGAITNDGVINVNIGNGNTSSGTDATAVGKSNTASGDDSSAVGRSNDASGNYSSAVGYGNTASTASSCAFGYNNDATGVGGKSSAFGYINAASGTAATAVGAYNTASGNYSSAVGAYNTASGSNSSALGRGNTASGIDSSAVGYINTASGDYSSAVGYFNTASGSYSSAVGTDNTASGYRSSAVGYENTASGTNSSAFGRSNTASGYHSSAFGYSNDASGNYSSAVGYNNTATGNFSSAVGRTNTASGIYSSAFGLFNTASDTGSSAVGHNNTASGAKSSAFGYTNTASGTYSSALGYYNTASGTDSSAFGYYNTATGNRSSAFGNTNTASGNYSSAVGYQNTANGHDSNAVGFLNGCSNISSIDSVTGVVTYSGGSPTYSTAGVASSMFGVGNQATGTYSSAFGYLNTASGNYSSAVGRTNTASGSKSSAFGYQNTASGANSSAVGSNNTASGNYSSAVGYSNDASGNYSSALGYDNTASGYRSSASGYNNTASGLDSSAVGGENTATGTTSSAVGFSNTATGSYSSAVGYGNTASGISSSAVGHYNTASSNNSSALGYTNTASATGSSAVGRSNTASGHGSSAFGYLNTASAVGSSAVGRNNTASGTQSSAVGYYSTAYGTNSSAVGSYNTASGTNSSAVGKSNITSGAHSSAFGYTNTASATGSSAVGRSNTASGAQSSAVGYYNTASGTNSSAVGFYNTASGTYSSAVGRSNDASATNSSAVGYYVQNGTTKATELGQWDSATARNGAIRLHTTGMAALTVQNRATEYGDAAEAQTVTITRYGTTATVSLTAHGYSVGSKITVAGANEVAYNGNFTVTAVGSADAFNYTAVSTPSASPATGTVTCTARLGSERDNRLARGMFAIRRDGLAFYLDYNDGGTIKNISLGTAA